MTYIYFSEYSNNKTLMFKLRVTSLINRFHVLKVEKKPKLKEPWSCQLCQALQCQSLMIRLLDQEKLLLLKLLFFSEMLAILTSPVKLDSYQLRPQITTCGWNNSIGMMIVPSSNAASCQWDESGFRCRPLQTWNNSTTHQKQLASSHQPINIPPSSSSAQLFNNN